VSVVFSDKGSRFIRKGQSPTKVDILRLAVGYLHATINRKTQNTEPEIGTDGSSQTWQNSRVDGYRSGFGPPRRCGLGFWMVQKPNQSVFPVRSRTAGGLPGPVPNTIQQYHGGAYEKFGNTTERWRELWVHLGAPGSAGEKSGCTSNHSRAVWEKQHPLWECYWCAWKS